MRVGDTKTQRFENALVWTGPETNLGLFLIWRPTYEKLASTPVRI